MNKIVKPITITLGMLSVPALGGNVTIERESDKEMHGDRGPLLSELERIERVHAMTPQDAAGVPLHPWFAGVKPGTYVRFVPRAIVAAKPWCSQCGKPLSIENGPAWSEPMFRCYNRDCAPGAPRGPLPGALAADVDENPRRPIDPVQPLRWWKRVWRRLVEHV